MQKAINQRLGISKDMGLDFPSLNQDESLPNFSLPSTFGDNHSETVIMNVGKSKSQSASQRPNNFNYHAYFTGSIRHHPKGLQVSSQGCSRVFIVKVLLKVSDYVQGKKLPSIFTFKRELVMGWLQEAKAACSDMNYDAEEAYYGGPPFIENDLSTHWSEPHQLYTWWKNNVERRTKYKIIQDDSLYQGADPRRVARARWCQVIVTLSEIIRASSGSTVSSITKQKAAEQKQELKRQKILERERIAGTDSDVVLTDDGAKPKATRKRKYDIDDEVLLAEEPKKEKKKPGRKKGWKKSVAKDDDSGSFADDFEESSDSGTEEVNVSHRLISKAPKEAKNTKVKEKPKIAKTAKTASPGNVLSNFAETAISLPFATLKHGASHFTKNLKTILTDLNDEDFLDLTVPKTKRVFIDINDTDKNDNNDTNNDDYYYAGPCFGIFYPKDSFTNSKTKPLNTSTMNTRAHLQLRKDINKKEKPCSRTGIEYQAEIEDMNPDAVNKEFAINQVWDSNKSENIDVAALYNNVSQSHRDEILELGLICRLKLPNVKDKSYRLCCILEIGIQDSNLVRVFDGRDELMVPPSSCIPFSVNYIEGLLAITHNSNYVEVMPSLQDMILHNSDRHDFASNWTAKEVAIFCSSIQRYGDNLRKVWLLFENTKTFKEILDFFHRVYPYTQRIGVKGFISIFRRADNAKIGIPDEVVEDDNNNGNQDDVEVELVQQQSYLKVDRAPEDDGEYLDGTSSGTGSGRGKRKKAKSDSPINMITFSTINSNFFASDNHFGTLQRKKKPGRPKQKLSSLGLANVDDDEEVLCICHILRTDDRYICCAVGNPDNCNGWVHLECVGLEDYTDEELQKLTDYICPSCQENNE